MVTCLSISDARTTQSQSQVERRARRARQDFVVRRLYRSALSFLFPCSPFSIHFFTLLHALPWHWWVSVVESQQCRNAAMANAPSVNLHTALGLRLEISMFGYGSVINNRFLENTQSKVKSQTSIPRPNRPQANQGIA